MTKEFLRSLDKKHSNLYNSRDNYLASICISTAVFCLICIGGALLIRLTGISDWFMERFIARGLTFIVIGTIAVVMANSFKSETKSQEDYSHNRSVLYFMLFPVIMSLALIESTAWWLFLIIAFFASLTLLLKDDVGENLYMRITAFANFAAPIIYLIIAIFVIGFSLENAFDFLFGAYFAFIFPTALWRVAMYVVCYEEKEIESSILNAIRQYPITMGYETALNVFLGTFLNIGEIMSEFEGAKK